MDSVLQTSTGNRVTNALRSLVNKMPEKKAFGRETMQASAEKIWGAAQEHLRSMLSADTYNLWFAPLQASALANSHLVLDLANDFCELWLKDNYMGLLQDVVALAAGRQLQIKFRVNAASA